MNKTISKMKAILKEYNTHKVDHIEMYVFSSTVEHIARISRIIRQPQGNALLLVGLGTDGKSIAKLAASIADYELQELTVTRGYKLEDWRTDLKKYIHSFIHSCRSIYLSTDLSSHQLSFFL